MNADCQYNGVEYKHGESWRPYGSIDPCFECRCTDGAFACESLVCPEPECDDPVVDLNECCPKCAGNFTK